MDTPHFIMPPRKNLADIVAVLLQYGANPYLESKGYTPIVISIINNCKETLAVFIKEKVDLTKTGFSRESPFNVRFRF